MIELLEWASRNPGIVILLSAIGLLFLIGSGLVFLLALEKMYPNGR